MSVILPPILALQSSWFSLYLNYRHHDSDIKEYGFLKFNEGTNVFSPLARFEVVTANTGTGLVHIRCVANKKFLLKKQGGGHLNLSPEADEPEEDQAKATCTLFEPQVAEDGNPNKIRLVHVNTKFYTKAYDDGGKRFFLLRGDGDWDHQCIFDTIDLDSLVILPKHLAFKGDNDCYLQQVDGNKLRFISNHKGDTGTWFEVSTDGDGNVEIMVFNSSNKGYLKFDSTSRDNWIITDASSSKFHPVMINASTVALQCLSNDKYCTRYSNTIGDGLSALNSSLSINPRAHLRLEELVLSRKIYNAEFDLKNSIIYGETPVTKASAIAKNDTATDNTVQITLKYTDTTSSTWSSKFSMSVGVTASVTFGIPFIEEASVTTHYEFSGEYEWGKTLTHEQTLEQTYIATVPANSAVTVSLMATQGKCDVPYSYYQKDLLYNGKTVVYKKDDGVYKGVNSYSFHIDVTSPKGPTLPLQLFRDPLIVLSKQQKTLLPLQHNGSTISVVPSTTTVEKEP